MVSCYSFYVGEPVLDMLDHNRDKILQIANFAVNIYYLGLMSLYKKKWFTEKNSAKPCFFYHWHNICITLKFSTRYQCISCLVG